MIFESIFVSLKEPIIYPKTLDVEHQCDIFQQIVYHIWDFHNTQEFLSKLTSFCKPGGTVLITSLTCDGFDIKTLWKDSNSVYPPHHINLLSKLGYRSLFESSGLKDIQIITPGKLDADIVKNFFKDKKNKKKLPNFLINILNDENLSKSFQEFLEDNKLSSHIWVFGIKKWRF